MRLIFEELLEVVGVNTKERKVKLLETTESWIFT